MIPEYKLYHGAAIAELIHRLGAALKIKERGDGGRLSSYALNDEVGAQIKHSSQRMPPWQFTFTKQNMSEILDLRENFDSVFIIFICHTDGMVCLDIEDTLDILGVGSSEQAWLRIDRRRGHHYSISSSSGGPVKRGGGLEPIIQCLRDTSALAASAESRS